MKRNKSKSKDRIRHHNGIEYSNIGRYVVCDNIFKHNHGSITFVHNEVLQDLVLDTETNFDERFLYISLTDYFKPRPIKCHSELKIIKIKLSRSKRFMNYSFINGDDYR